MFRLYMPSDGQITQLHMGIYLGTQILVKQCSSWYMEQMEIFIM